MAGVKVGQWKVMEPPWRNGVWSVAENGILHAVRFGKAGPSGGCWCRVCACSAEAEAVAVHLQDVDTVLPPMDAPLDPYFEVLSHLNDALHARPNEPSEIDGDWHAANGIQHLSLDGRGVEELAVGMQDFGSFQDRIMLEKFMVATLNANSGSPDRRVRQALHSH